MNHIVTEGKAGQKPGGITSDLNDLNVKPKRGGKGYAISASYLLNRVP